MLSALHHVSKHQHVPETFHQSCLTEEVTEARGRESAETARASTPLASQHATTSGRILRGGSGKQLGHRRGSIAVTPPQIGAERLLPSAETDGATANLAKNRTR